MSDKTFRTNGELVELLQSRGLELDVEEALQWLRAIGYYRLSGYCYPYRAQIPGGKKRRDEYVPGIKFTDVVELYEFDRKLRTYIFDATERVEVALRAAIAKHFGAIAHDSYADPKNFRPADPEKKKNLFDHADWLAQVDSRVARARAGGYEAVSHWYDKYPNERLPVWILVDILDFSDLSKAYMGLPTRAQWGIAEMLGIYIDLEKLSATQQVKVKKMHPLSSWLRQLTVVRNTCAHHARLWNKDFPPASPEALRVIPGLEHLPEGRSMSIFGALAVMAYILEVVSPGSPWKKKVNELVESYLTRLPHRSPQEMGFPKGGWL